MYLRVMKAKYKMPQDISSSAKSLIRSLLVKIEKRMVDIDEIKSHRWFVKDWDTVAQRGMQPLLP